MKKILSLLVLSIFCSQLNLHAAASADIDWGDPEAVQHKQSPKESSQQPTVQEPVTTKEKLRKLFRKYGAYIAAAVGIAVLSGGVIVTHRKGWWPFGTTDDSDKTPENTDITPHLVVLDQFTSEQQALIRKVFQDDYSFNKNRWELIRTLKRTSGAEFEMLEQSFENPYTKLQQAGLIRLGGEAKNEIHIAYDRIARINSTNNIIHAYALDFEPLTLNSSEQEIARMEEKVTAKTDFENSEVLRLAYNRRARRDEALRELGNEGVMIVGEQNAPILQEYLDAKLALIQAEYEQLVNNQALSAQITTRLEIAENAMIDASLAGHLLSEELPNGEGVPVGPFMCFTRQAIFAPKVLTSRVIYVHTHKLIARLYELTGLPPEPEVGDTHEIINAYRIAVEEKLAQEQARLREG